MDIGKLVNTDESRTTSILAYQLKNHTPYSFKFDISPHPNKLKAHKAWLNIGNKPS